MKEHVVHAYCDDALGRFDATALADRIATGELTADEVTAAAMERIRTVNPALNAMALEVTPGSVVPPARGPQEFAGVPALIKDNLEVAGLPTRHGATAVAPHPARHTDPLAQQFLAQGFSLVGKTNLPEFGFNGSTEYQDGTATHNPWDVRYTAGGSSGGSAALVAAGAVPIAHGNDGGGSIRIPAACCGLVGLKPGRGRLVVSNLGKHLPLNIVADGVLTRSVRDTANFMAAAEVYRYNPALRPIGRVTGPGQRRLRVAVMVEAITREALDQDTATAMDDTVSLLNALGHETTPMAFPLPPEFARGFLIYYGFLAFAVSNFGRLLFGAGFDREKLDGLTRGLNRYFRQHLRDIPGALMHYRRASRIFHAELRKYDVILSPVTGYAAPELGYLSPNVPFEELMSRLTHFGGFTALYNVLGNPAISLPLHRGADGRPVGVQFAAANGEERRLLELAFELEEARPFTQLWQLD